METKRTAKIQKKEQIAKWSVCLFFKINIVNDQPKS